MCAAVSGATMVFPHESFDAEATLRAVEAERCTAIYGVPTMFIAELEHPSFPPARYVVVADGNHGRQPLPDRAHETRRPARWGPARSPLPTARRKRRR